MLYMVLEMNILGHEIDLLLVDVIELARSLCRFFLAELASSFLELWNLEFSENFGLNKIFLATQNTIKFTQGKFFRYKYEFSSY